MATCTKWSACICVFYALYRVHKSVIQYPHNEVAKVAISYQGAFEKMKEAGITTYRIRKENILSQSTLQKLREGKPVTTETIEKLCLLMDCTPNDIMKITR